jgi:hypothetical protein
MKKVLFFLLLLGSTATTTFAQVGIKGGVGIATMSQEGEGFSNEDVDRNSILTPVVGLTFDLNVSDMFTIQPELLYTQLGTKNTYDLLGIRNESSYRINYLELPVLAKLQLGNADREGVGFYVAAGPWVGYALNGKSQFKSTTDGNTLLDIDRELTFDDEDDTRRLNYGMVGAAGLTFGRVGLDLRYNYGLNNLLDADADNTNDNKPVLQTRGLALTLGYSF